MKFAEPVTHEFGCFFHITDLDLYYAVVNYYSNNVDDPYNHYIQIGDRNFKFSSKYGGLISPKTKKLAFEYKLHWTDKDKASKCSYFIKPLFGRGTKTKYGKTLNLPSVGTQIHIESSYIDLDEHFDIIYSILDFFGASRFKDKIDYSRSKIYQMARHVRYHERYEHDMVVMLQAIRQESSMRGDLDLIERLRSGKYDMYKLDYPDFSVCNIRTEYQHSVKSYRIKNFLKRVPEDLLRHPKLEVFLKSESGQNPSISEYLSLKKDLDKLLFSLISFLNQPIEYVSDNYFDAERVFEYRYDLPEWNYLNQSHQAEHIDLGENLRAVKALAYIALQSEGCADFRDIQEATEIPERTLWRFINYWKSEGYIDTIRENCTKVFFTTKSKWEASKQPLIDFCSAFHIGFKKIFGEVFIDSGVIRQYRKRAKNLRIIKSKESAKRSKDQEPIIVDTFQKGKSLLKEFKELGISRRVAVVSNHNTARYSRVL